MRHQPLDLALGEIAPFDCQVFDAWGAFLGCRFHRDKMLLPNAKWITNTPFLHSYKGRTGEVLRSRCRMGGSVRHEVAARAAKRRARRPPVGGLFVFKFLSILSIRGLPVAAAGPVVVRNIFLGVAVEPTQIER